MEWKEKPAGVLDSELGFPMKSGDDSTWEDLTGLIAKAQDHIIAKSGKKESSEGGNSQITQIFARNGA